RMKHVVHQPLLVGERHPAVAEIGLLAAGLLGGAGHRKSSFVDRTIARRGRGGYLSGPALGRLTMPELPEVGTPRRGLAPAMEDARFEEVVAHRGDLRWPLPKDFVARLKGQTVTGLGRRAKYLLADLSSGDVLLMHLGMSGSFRVIDAGKAKTPGL